MTSRRQFLGMTAATTMLGSAALRAQAAPLSVVATTGMIADAAAAVGGAQVSARSLMGPGIDPHAYRQTRSDIVAMTRADLVLWHGLFLEAQMVPFFGELSSRTTVIAVAETLPTEQLRAHDDYADRYDPHIWMDPALWRAAVPAIRDSMQSLRPDALEIFAENAALYEAEIARVGAYAETVLASVPPERRILVTAHDAFGYFGDAYGFRVEGIQGISTESEAGLSRIAELVDLLVENRVGAVFVESSVSDRNIRALIEGAAARGLEVAIGGELFSDAMGAPGTYEGSYVGMIDHNATVIARALGGAAPARGMDDRLSAGL